MPVNRMNENIVFVVV